MPVTSDVVKMGEASDDSDLTLYLRGD